MCESKLNGDDQTCFSESRKQARKHTLPVLNTMLSFQAGTERQKEKKQDAQL
jgi:hypothetical protein